MKKPQEAFATTPDEYSQLRLMQLLLSSEALKLVPNYADAQCTDLTATAGQWRIVEYLVRSNANLETQPRRNAREETCCRQLIQLSCARKPHAICVVIIDEAHRGIPDERGVRYWEMRA